MLSQFTPEAGSRWRTLADHIATPHVYPAGRLDADSEGLLLLTDRGRLQQRLTDPRWGHWRRYWVQVEGHPGNDRLEDLRRGLTIQGRRTRPARVRAIDHPPVAERVPPIRSRRTVPTHWLEIELTEGRNRQVRRMTAAIGCPTLRLIRIGIDLMDGGPDLVLDDLMPGCWRAACPMELERLRRVESGVRRPRR